MGETRRTWIHLALPLAAGVLAATACGPVSGVKVPAPTTAAVPAGTITAAEPFVGVEPDAFCSPAGATGYTNAGTPMVCASSPTDPRYRWRTA